VLRRGPEEQMMRERFGQEYVDYASRTKQLVPGVF
jgi:protein-S-isoprenylcysteine O-methyltransferase Ste14